LENQFNYFNGYLGGKKSPIDKRDYTLASVEESFEDWFELPLVDEIKNQEQVGSCVAHSWSYVREYWYKLITGTYKRFSVGYIYGNKSDQTSSGMIPREGAQILLKLGDVFNDDFDYNLEFPDIFNKLQEVGIDKLNSLASNHKVLTYFSVTSINEIKTALKKYGYVSICIPWYEDNNFDVVIDDKHGVLPVVSKGQTLSGLHEVTIYGWSPYGFLLLNSWGTEWGRNGTAILPYDYGFPVSEGWCITSTDDIGIKKPSQNPIYQLLAKFVNWILNKFTKHK
jgi:hypothetical protein